MDFFSLLRIERSCSRGEQKSKNKNPNLWKGAMKMKIQKAIQNMKQHLILIFVGLIFNILLGTSSLSVGAQDVWMQKADMPTGRLWHASSVVDGKIYVIGGRATEALTTEYNPLTDTWTTKAPMPTARFTHSTIVVDGKIYAIGGGAGAWKPGLSVVEEYDPMTDTWTTKAPMPTARGWGLATSVVDGKIYAIGGTGSSSLWADFRRTVEAYDPLTDTWSKKADMPTARIFFSASVVDGKIYAIGGVLVTKAGLSTVEAYDPATDTWTTKTPMPTARHAHASAVVDGKIYVIGGGPDGGANHAGPDGLSVVEAYDPTTDTWTTKADIPAPRGLLSASAVDGKIYAIGGKTTTKDPHPPGLPTVYEYDATPPLVVDFNGDGTVDIKDLLRLIESWGQDDPLCDIAPPPFRDGIIDAMDLELLISYWEQPVDDPTLLAHWALDEAEGTFAYDSAGLNDAVVVGGTEWQPSDGQVDGALQFNGVSGCAISGPVLNPADGPFSVFAWVNGGAPGQIVLSQSNGANWLGADLDFGCIMTELIPPAVGRFVPQPLKSESVITDDQWHRVGFVWDGTNRALYVDDILVAEDTQANLQGSDAGLYIGTDKAMELGTYWSGLIDDVRIYNRAVRP
jgi:N-acetylneuraminic acid mutarotase